MEGELPVAPLLAPAADPPSPDPPAPCASADDVPAIAVGQKEMLMPIAGKKQTKETVEEHRPQITKIDLVVQGTLMAGIADRPKHVVNLSDGIPNRKA